MSNQLRILKSAQFKAAAIRLGEIAAEVDGMALIFDETGHRCDCCGANRLHNFPQYQVRTRVSGAATRLREISETLQRRAQDDEFLGAADHAGLLTEKARAALDAVPLVDGAVVALPPHVFNLLQQALGRPKVTP